jgi:hypothetical protein
VSGRLVVYLDTNLVSLLAKVSLGQPLPEPDSRLGQEALGFFTSLVDSRVAIFPDSWTRRHEVELRGEAQFEDAVRKIAARLSRGVRFHTDRQILDNQIRNLFVAHLDGTKHVPTWQEAFPYDPHGAIPSDVEEDATHSWVESDGQRRQHRRQLKRLSVKYHQERAQQRANLTLRYKDLKTVNARKHAEMIVLGPARRFLLGERLDFDHKMAATMIGGAVSVATERGDIWGTSFWNFANSAVILKVPAIDIWASIETSIELDEPSRDWKGSDLYDLQALSDGLPYCNAVFCDRNMKGILRRRGIASRYGSALYSMADFEQFRRDVEAGPAGPLRAMDPRVAPIVECWDEVTEYLVEVAHTVDCQRWSASSPYPGWTYKDLLVHLATGYTVRLAQLRDLLEKRQLGPQPDADAANAENIARHRESSPEALVEEMVRQRSEVRRLIGLLRPEHLEVRMTLRRRGQEPRATTFVEALQHWHEHDLEHAADLAPIMRWPLAPPEA